MANNKEFGKVIFFKNTYGFIAWEGHDDLFVHFSDISNDGGYKTLQKGQEVSFEVGVNHTGKPKAINVKTK